METDEQFIIAWLDRGRPPRQPPNPVYPAGCHVDLTDEAMAEDRVKLHVMPNDGCIAALPYPTGRENVGTWLVECRLCGVKVAVTAASRPDDPRSVKLPCKMAEHSSDGLKEKP